MPWRMSGRVQHGDAGNRRLCVPETDESVDGTFRRAQQRVSECAAPLLRHFARQRRERLFHGVRRYFDEHLIALNVRALDFGGPGQGTRVCVLFQGRHSSDMVDVLMGEDEVGDGFKRFARRCHRFAEQWELSGIPGVDQDDAGIVTDQASGE